MVKWARVTGHRAPGCKALQAVPRGLRPKEGLYA